MAVALVDCERYGEGRINDVFKLAPEENGKEVHLILQRINNRLFPDVAKLMHNIGFVTDFCCRSVWRMRATHAFLVAQQQLQMTFCRRMLGALAALRNGARGAGVRRGGNARDGAKYCRRIEKNLFCK